MGTINNGQQTADRGRRREAVDKGHWTKDREHVDRRDGMEYKGQRTGTEDSVQMTSETGQQTDDKGARTCDKGQRTDDRKDRCRLQGTWDNG